MNTKRYSLVLTVLICLWFSTLTAAYYFQSKYQIEPRTCINCARCVPKCPNKAIFKKNATFTIDQSKCNGCGACVSSCPVRAIKPSTTTDIHSSDVSQVHHTGVITSFSLYSTPELIRVNFYLTTVVPVSLNVFDIAGKEVISSIQIPNTHRGTNDVSLSNDSFSKGFYIVKAIAGTEVKTYLFGIK